MNLPPVVGRLVGDNSDYVRSLNQAEAATKGSTDRSAGHFSKLGDHIKKAVVLGTAAAGVAVAGFAVKAISAASDLAETVSKVGVVFGDQAKQVTGFANDMASKFGLPKTAILDAASSIGLIGKASGLSQADAAKMSTQLGKLAADASSFYNVPLPEALDAIKSGLVGEAEPMRRFGVLLNEQSVSAEAARLGLAKTNGEYSEGAKAQARASLIMRGMTDASGDLERTQGSLANRIRELKGRAENFAASAGTLVVPVLLKLLDVGEKVGSVVGPALRGVFDILAKGDFTGGLFGAEEDSPIVDSLFRIREAVMEAWPQIKATILDAVDAIVGWVRQHWPEIKHIITETLTTVQAVVKGVVDLVTTIWENFGSQIKDVVAAAWRYVRDTIEGALKVIQGIVKVITGIIHGDWGQVWEGIKQVLAGAWEMIQARIELGLNIIKNIISVALEIVKAIFSEAWNTVFEVTRNILATVVDVFLGAVEFIINGAARAFGWIPGIGPKLREAADRFAEFRDEVNAYLRGIHDKTVNVTINEITYRSTVQGQQARSPGNPGGYTPEFARGMEMGPVPGTYGQLVHILAHAGEWVLTPEQLNRLTRWAMGGLGGSSRDAVIAAMTHDQRAAISAAQGFGEHNISASGGYHAYRSPTAGDYYSRKAGFIDDQYGNLVPHGSSSDPVYGGSAVAGYGGGGSVTINNYLTVSTTTGDIPDSTIRKIRTQLFALTDDLPAGSIVPAA